MGQRNTSSEFTRRSLARLPPAIGNFQKELATSHQPTPGESRKFYLSGAFIGSESARGGSERWIGEH